jgi:hypothetical protein
MYVKSIWAVSVDDCKSLQRFHNILCFVTSNLIHLCDLFVALICSDGIVGIQEKKSCCWHMFERILTVTSRCQKQYNNVLDIMGLSTLADREEAVLKTQKYWLNATVQTFSSSLSEILFIYS